MFDLLSYTVQLDQPGHPVLVNVMGRVPFGNRVLDLPVKLSFELADLERAEGNGIFGGGDVCELIHRKLGAIVAVPEAGS